MILCKTIFSNSSQKYITISHPKTMHRLTITPFSKHFSPPIWQQSLTQSHQTFTPKPFNYLKTFENFHKFSCLLSRTRPSILYLSVVPTITNQPKTTNPTNSNPKNKQLLFKREKTSFQIQKTTIPNVNKQTSCQQTKTKENLKTKKPPKKLKILCLPLKM